MCCLGKYLGQDRRSKNGKGAGQPSPAVVAGVGTEVTKPKPANDWTSIDVFLGGGGREGEGEDIVSVISNSMYGSAELSEPTFLTMDSWPTYNNGSKDDSKASWSGENLLVAFTMYDWCHLVAVDLETGSV